MSNHLGLGRRAAPDARDTNFPIRALVSTDSPKTFAYYTGGMFLDQGSKPHCVEYSWHHYIQTGKIRPRRRWPYWNYGEPYAEMQKVDEWDGENYNGTSVRAGAKIMQQMGFIDSYLWAWDLNTVVNAVLETGPVVMGTNWYSSMFDTDDKGILRVGGRIEGGHAWLLDGVSRKKGMARAKNSWSRNWGRRGRFFIPFEDLERLILEDGEACLSVETVGD